MYLCWRLKHRKCVWIRADTLTFADCLMCGSDKPCTFSCHSGSSCCSHERAVYSTVKDRCVGETNAVGEMMVYGSGGLWGRGLLIWFALFIEWIFRPLENESKHAYFNFTLNLHRIYRLVSSTPTQVRCAMNSNTYRSRYIHCTELELSVHSELNPSHLSVPIWISKHTRVNFQTRYSKQKVDKSIESKINYIELVSIV